MNTTVGYVPTFPRVRDALRARGSATLAELAADTGLTVDTVAADCGAMHDHGMATRYGTAPQSIAAWQGDSE